MPVHFKTLWKSRSINTPSGQLVWEAAEYIYCVWTADVRGRRVYILRVDSWHERPQSIYTACGQLTWEATEYIYSARTESVNVPEQLSQNSDWATRPRNHGWILGRGSWFSSFPQCADHLWELRILLFSGLSFPRDKAARAWSWSLTFI
jgi:hypothetical protein